MDKLTSYCSKYKLDEPYQSAYGKKLSCETALQEVSNRILTYMDNRKIALLTLLDLSAVFDAVSNDCFLVRLESCYGISGIALQWFASSFENCSSDQSVNVRDSMSDAQLLSTSMSQGSGPVKIFRSSLRRTFLSLITSSTIHGFNVWIFMRFSRTGLKVSRVFRIVDK